MALSTHTKYVSLVIQQQKQQLDYGKLTEWLNTNCSMWAYITHNKDKYDDGTDKGLHIHVKCVLNESNVRLSTTLNSVSQYLYIEKDAFTIEKMESIEGSLQYLIHKNDKKKAQYDIDEIKTNMTQSELCSYIYADSTTINTESLIAVCSQNYHSKIAILRAIGLRYYTQYRGVISDIVNELENISIRSK